MSLTHCIMHCPSLCQAVSLVPDWLYAAVVPDPNTASTSLLQPWSRRSWEAGDSDQAPTAEIARCSYAAGDFMCRHVAVTLCAVRLHKLLILSRCFAADNRLCCV